MTNKQNKPNVIRQFFSLLGPGLITGAADDDPSGVATYSIAGAQLGMAQLWTAFVTWPFMACVQFMCARVGMVTGRGLAGAMRQKFPGWALFSTACALFAANSVNVGSDLSGMSDAVEMLTGINSHLFVVVFGIGIAYCAIRWRYYQIALVLKWLAFCLFAYVITAFVVKPNWSTVLRHTFIYAFAETFQWREGLDHRLRRARVLCRAHRFHAGRHCDGFPWDQSSESAFLDRSH